MEGNDKQHCPFCGFSDTYLASRVVGWQHDRETTRRLVTVCSMCGAQGPAFGIMSFNNEQTAMSYWNRRQPPQSPARDEGEMERPLAPQAEARQLQNTRGCLKSGPGRGDCLHFLGLPSVFNELTTDVYGVPNGWCVVCWYVYRIDALKGEHHE